MEGHEGDITIKWDVWPGLDADQKIGISGTTDKNWQNLRRVH